MENKADNLSELERDILDAENILEEKEVKEVKEEHEEVNESEEPPKKVEEKIEDKVDGVDEERENQKLKSQFGRIAKRHMKEVSIEIDNKLSKVLSKIDERLESFGKKSVEEEEELPDDATPEDLRNYLKKQKEKIVSEVRNEVNNKKTKEVEDVEGKKSTYRNQYQDLLEDMLDPEDDDDKEVYALMTKVGPNGVATDFNSVHSNFEDARNDFLINYRSATKSVLNSSKKKVRTTVVNKQQKIPSGVNIPGNQKAKVVDTTNWAKEEREMVRDFGLTADDLADLL
jgi:hypothetical protein